MTHDEPTKILVSADAQSGHDMAKIFSSLLPEAAKIYAYRFVTENIFSRSILGAVTTMTFGYLAGSCDVWLPNWMKWYSKSNIKSFIFYQSQLVIITWSQASCFNKHLLVDLWKSQFEGYYLLLDLHGFLYYSDMVLLLLQTTMCYTEFTLAMWVCRLKDLC